MKQSIYILIAGLILGLIFMPQSFIILIFSSVLISAIAAQGLSLISGFTGQVSIGHGAFMAIGAYTTAYLSTVHNVPFIVNILISVILAAVFGLIIGLPALRLKGFYLAIATMAFGVAIEQIISSFDALGGHIGIRNIPKLINSDFGMFIINLLFYAVLSYISNRIINSSIGSKYKMIRDSEIASKSYGINVSSVKLHAFVVSAVYGGIAGSLYAHTLGYIAPTDFALGTSLNLLAMIVIGGMTSVQGGLIGSVIITGLPFMFSRTAIPMSLIFGTLLIIFVLFFPQGIAYGIRLGYMKYFEIPLVSFIRKNWKNNKIDGKIIKVKNTDIFYRSQGEGKPVIMIHGNFGSSRWFKKVMNIKGYTVYAPDLPNFGFSGRIKDADIDIYADYIKSFMEELKIEKALIVGHSLGGAVAQSLAYRYPEKVEKMLLVDSSPVNGLKTPEENYPVLNIYYNNYSLVKNALKAMMPSSKDKKLLSELSKDALLMKKECFTENARALEKYDYTDISKNFKGKVLFILGKKDTLITQDMVSKTLENLDGKMEYIETAGHSLITENPDLFIENFKTFAG
ncbi:MAG: alpha/beta fold hydrolase [Thermotogae bacterium]|nr:alpha/beta fold hydrolase [Thermotogota bacterium]HOO74082.1 alpha/beta fold hydrolase [Tepiditoga sp.]